jgi:Tol biopolymer transport system component/DNA-binding winged helix-turn-helix (wHTH) protein
MSYNLPVGALGGDHLRYRFGSFELEVCTGELRRNGLKVRLQEQPFLVLRKLLEAPGGMVSREELHAALWPANTFVDFDTSLNTAIKRLREALGDSADLPVFIETVPRRGYRFLAPVQAVGNGKPVALPVELPVHTAPAHRFRLGLSVAGLILAAATGGIIVAVRSPAPLPRVRDSAQLTFDGNLKGNLLVRAGQIYFNEQRGEQLLLVKVSTMGGPQVVLNSSNNGLYLADASADGNKLLVLSPIDKVRGPDRLMLMDLAAGSLQDLYSAECHSATWAPDGRIVFGRAESLFMAEADGSHQRKLLSAPGTIFHVRFSPDGKRMRFSLGKEMSRTTTIWEALPDGSGLHEILTDMKDYPQRCCGEWSADGRYYFFQTNLNGDSKIWVQAERGSFWRSGTAPPIQLTTVPPNYYLGSPSANGKQLMVTGAQPRAELVRYDNSSRQFVPYLSGISAGDVESSRQGNALVYIKYPEATLWRAKPDGSDATQLTGPSLRAYLPHWSPDGKFIAFSGSRPGRPWNIFVIPSTGGPAEQITNGTVSDLDASWSHDGSRLVFGQTRQVDGKLIPSIQVLDVATRQVTPIPGGDGICCSRWSPDGRYIIASHGTYEDLLLYDFNTQTWSTILKNKGPIGYMEWSADSKSVVFDTFEVDEPAFYRIWVSNSQVETIASAAGIRRYYGEFGPWTGVTPDGSPLLVRDTSNEELYSLDLQLP